MPKPSSVLLRALSPLKSTYQWSSSSPPVYSIGLSYAGKDSPPFVSPNARPPRTGFAHSPSGKADHIRDWVRASGKITAGRGELESTAVGGWTDAVRDRVAKWGAGEDFFALEGSDASISSIGVFQESSIGKNGPVHLAISDGVGGWSDTVDPSFFSQASMYHYAKSARKALESATPENPPKTGPLDHSRDAFEGVLKEPVVVAGGATACGVSLDSKGVLNGVNLGDSGMSIIRDGKSVYATPPGTHYFNCPKQLSKIPRSMMSQGIITDKPDTASDTFTAQSQPGDVIMLYTDGLSDNVPAEHYTLLLSHLSEILARPENAHSSPLDRASELARLFADVLVGYGRAAMVRTGDEAEEVDGKVRRSWRTPFEVEAEREGMRYKGGKVDDITVLTAVVSEKNPESD